MELETYLESVRVGKREGTREDVPILMAMIEAARAAHSGYASDAAEEAMQSVLDSEQGKP